MFRWAFTLAKMARSGDLSWTTAKAASLQNASKHIKTQVLWLGWTALLAGALLWVLVLRQLNLFQHHKILSQCIKVQHGQRTQIRRTAQFSFSCRYIHWMERILRQALGIYTCTSTILYNMRNWLHVLDWKWLESIRRAWFVRVFELIQLYAISMSLDDILGTRWVCFSVVAKPSRGAFSNSWTCRPLGTQSY